jgi:O-antigen ligase
MLFAKPLFGVGPEQFASAVGEFGGVPNLAAHNTFIQIFAENGVLAGISFCLFIFMPLLFNIKLLKRKQVNSDKEWAVESYQYVSIALIGFLVCALFSNRNQFYILFVLVGLLVAIKENMLFFNESSIKA